MSAAGRPIDRLTDEPVLAQTRRCQKVTSKPQVTIPKAIAERYSIAPGDEVEWIGASESVRLVPARR
jgi:AbrB family looped-hinge helix DNA binding protein